MPLFSNGRNKPTVGKSMVAYRLKNIKAIDGKTIENVRKKNNFDIWNENFYEKARESFCQMILINENFWQKAL